MVNLIVDISKYLMILLIAVYTYLNFRFFGVADDKKQSICGKQNVVMYLIHALAYMILYLMTKDTNVLVFYGAQVIFFLSYQYLSKLFYRNISRLLLNNMCLLLSVGFIILTRLSFDRAVKQFVIVAASAVLTFVVPYLMGRVWQLGKIPLVYGGIGILLLLVVCLIGQSSYGAQLSLSFRGISFQPMELVKITYVFFIAAMFYKSTDFKTVLITTAVAALHVLILALSNDLGSALILFITYLFMLFVATSNWLYLGGGTMGGCLAAVLAYRLFAHVRVRVAAWRNPWADIDKDGYQITQSLFAIGTGGWFGMGLYQGMPKKIPVVEKDFVFAAISEELGGIFALCILLICLGCFLQFMMIANRMQASFFKLLAFGLGVIYAVQVILTVGGVTKFIPSTGVTLPLVSYGGSSIFGTFLLFGVIQGLYVLKRNEEDEYDMERKKVSKRK